MPPRPAAAAIRRVVRGVGVPPGIDDQADETEQHQADGQPPAEQCEERAVQVGVGDDEVVAGERTEVADQPGDRGQRQADDEDGDVGELPGHVPLYACRRTGSRGARAP